MDFIGGISAGKLDADNWLAAQLAEAAEFLRERLGMLRPQIGLVLGSGLNALGEEIETPVRIPFIDVPHMSASTADGHVGCFVAGTLEGEQILAMQGRLHGYEGNSAVDVAFPIWLMALLGVRTLITTNAAGAINDTFHVGDFCVMSDQINFTGRNPIANAQAAGMAERFFSMTDCFDPSLRALAMRAGREEGIGICEGVYLGLLGPSFETPAEIRAFRAIGADTVAMSVCEEVIAARHGGMRVLGISLISNMAAGVGAMDGEGGASPTGGEVLDVGKANERSFSALVRAILRTMAQ